MNKLKELEELIWQWAKERNLDKVDPFAQACKTVEEALELKEAIKNNNIDEIKDAIGDVFVTLVICSRLLNLKIEDCVEYAYNQIKDRKGRLICGIFVKEENLIKDEKSYLNKEVK